MAQAGTSPCASGSKEPLRLTARLAFQIYGQGILQNVNLSYPNKKEKKTSPNHHFSIKQRLKIKVVYISLPQDRNPYVIIPIQAFSIRNRWISKRTKNKIGFFRYKLWSKRLAPLTSLVHIISYFLHSIHSLYLWYSPLPTMRTWQSSEEKDRCVKSFSPSVDISNAIIARIWADALQCQKPRLCLL